WVEERRPALGQEQECESRVPRRRIEPHDPVDTSIIAEGHRGDARIPDEDVDAERWFLGVGDHERAAERQLPYGGGALLADPTERANEVGRMTRPSLALASHRITARSGGRQRQRQHT